MPKEDEMVFQVGDFVGVRCEVKPGPFDEERLITVSAVDGPISGFVRDSELRQTGDQWEVRCKVREINGNILTVLIYGSFFTTNGITSVNSDLAMAA